MIETIYKNLPLIKEKTLHPLEILQVRKSINFIGNNDVLMMLENYKNFFFSDLNEEDCEKLVQKKTGKRKNIKLVPVHYRDLMIENLTFEKVKELYDLKNENNEYYDRNDEFQYFIYKGNDDYFLIVNRFPLKGLFSYNNFVSFDRYADDDPKTVNNFFHSYFFRVRKNYEVHDFISHIIEIVEKRVEDNNPANSLNILREILNLMVIFDVVYLLTINKNNDISVFVKMMIRFRGESHHNTKMVVMNINFNRDGPKIISDNVFGDFFSMGFMDRFSYYHHHFMRVDTTRREIKYLRTASYFIFRNSFSVSRFDYFGIMRSIFNFIKSDHILKPTSEEKNRYDFVVISREYEGKNSMNSIFNFSFFNVLENNDKKSVDQISEPYFVGMNFNYQNPKKYKFQVLAWNNTNNKNNIYGISNDLGASIIVFDDSLSYDLNKKIMVSSKTFYKRYVTYHQGRKNLSKKVYKNLNELLHDVTNRKKKNVKDKITKMLLMAPCEIDDVRDYI